MDEVGKHTIFISREKEQVYEFDSRKHPGCTIYVAGQKVDWILFTIVKHVNHTYQNKGDSPDFTGVFYDIKGKLDVEGVEKGITDENGTVINIYSYSPVSEKDFVFTVTGCYIGNDGSLWASHFYHWREVQPVKELDDGTYILMKL